MPVLRKLFKLRNRLVHPKPGFGTAQALGPLGDFEAQFTGGKIADFLVAVAAAGTVLVKRTYGPDHLDIWTNLAWLGQDTLFELGEESEQLPPVDSDRVKKLTQRLIDIRQPARAASES